MKTDELSLADWLTRKADGEQVEVVGIDRERGTIAVLPVEVMRADAWSDDPRRFDWVAPSLFAPRHLLKTEGRKK